MGLGLALVTGRAASASVTTAQAAGPRVSVTDRLSGVNLAHAHIGLAMGNGIYFSSPSVRARMIISWTTAAQVGYVVVARASVPDAAVLRIWVGACPNTWCLLRLWCLRGFR